MKPVAVITGSSRGIGKSIAKKLAKSGYSIMLVARNKQKLEECRKELLNEGSPVFSFAVDLADPGTPELIVQETIKNFGKLDVLINNAGIALNNPLLECSPKQWDQIFNINVKCPYFLCQKAIPFLKKSVRPIIINIGSVVDYKGYINQSIYAASKHALAGFTSAMAKEVQNAGIRVHLISPGGVNTDMVTGVRPDLDTSELISPDEIAEIIDFLCNYSGKGTIDRIRIRRFNSLPFD